MSPPKPKKVEPPALPSPVATTTEIAPEAAKAGRTERRRIMGQRGKASTILAGRRPMGAATVQQAGLLTHLGGR